MKYKDQIQRDLGDIQNDLQVIRNLINRAAITGEDAVKRINVVLQIAARLQENINRS